MKKAEILRAIKEGTILVWNADIRNSVSYRSRNRRVLVKIVAEIKGGQVIPEGTDIAKLRLRTDSIVPQTFAYEGGWVIQPIERRTAAERNFYEEEVLWVSGKAGGRTNQALVPSRELECAAIDFSGEVEANYEKSRQQDAANAEWAQELAIKFGTGVKFGVRSDGGVELRFNDSTTYSRYDGAMEAEAQLVLRALDPDAQAVAVYTLPHFSSGGALSLTLAELLIDAPEGEVFLHPETVGRALAYEASGLERMSLKVRDGDAIREALRAVAPALEVPIAERGAAA